MSPRSRKEYIEVTSLRYKKASRKRKTAILDEFCATCQLPPQTCYPNTAKFQTIYQTQNQETGKDSSLS
jgi:hypothetical protein